MSQWTAERRLRQSQLIHQWKPWESAGVKTPEGKAISRMNAKKHGLRSAEIRQLIKDLAQYRQFLTDFFVKTE